MNKECKNKALSMIPKKSPYVYWQRKEKLITLIIKRNKKIDKIKNKLFNTPINIKINLDEIGSFIWESCDGISNVSDISKKLKERFGEKSEPVVMKLVTYIRILKNNKFIHIE